MASQNGDVSLGGIAVRRETRDELQKHSGALNRLR